MNVAVGIMESRSSISVELSGTFSDESGASYLPGRYVFTGPVVLHPSDPLSCAFALENVTIGIGFHWERDERQVFRGSLRILQRQAGLTAVNDVSLEDYVTSVASSEMSSSCPIELLKAHAVIARSWLKASPLPAAASRVEGSANEVGSSSRDILKWYGRESHPDFEVCADDHCQRYQGITKALSADVSRAVLATSGEFLLYDGSICDARFSKSCGGVTEVFASAWQDIDVPYLKSFFDGPSAEHSYTPESLIRSDVPAYCNTKDPNLLAQILPGFDQETTDFFRWKVEYTPEEVRQLLKARIDRDPGDVLDLKPLSRGPSGRIIRLQIVGSREAFSIGKELEIRRALSRSHLYSSAFVVDREHGKFVLKGAGWGHGVGLCQIGAAVMASRGKNYREILSHYYPGATPGRKP